MSLRFLLDTNIISESMKTRPNPGVMRRLATHRDDYALAAQVWHELLFGVGRLPPGRRKLQFTNRLTTIEETLNILPYDADAAAWHAGERVRLARERKTAPFDDGLIGAVAHVNGLILVTRNVKDFRWFPELVIENWFESE